MSNINGYFFSHFNMLMHDMLKRKKKYAMNQKEKDQKCFKHDYKLVF